MNEPDVKEYSILHWLFSNGVTSEKGEPLDFKDHAFLLDILTDWSKNIACKACAQVGKSITFNYKALFACAKFRWNIIYTMPTDESIREFVGTKTNRILSSNPQVFKGIQTDNIERKDMGGRSIFFKGTESKSAPISTSADLLIHDEASRSNQEALNTYKSRTKDSAYKGRWLFSNPTTERDVLDLEWQKSDMKEWHITCPSCKDEHYLTYPDSFDKEKKIYICKACKEPISDDVRRKGRWINQDGEVWEGLLNPKYDVSGWHLSHLIATKITAREVLEDSEGDQEYFYNFVLGEPYNPGDLTVSRTTILDLWTPKDLITGNWFLGVDVGNVKHFVLGSELGITKVGKFTEWSVLDDMMKFYKPKLVIDALPDSTMSKYFVKTYRNALMSYFQDNNNNPQTIVWYGEGERAGIVYSNRNRVLDSMIVDMTEAKFLIGVPSNKEFIEYIKHFETLRRVKNTNAKGIEFYEWTSNTGTDHFCFTGDTKIMTSNGNKKIKDIKAGEYVLTRKGFKKVLKSGITKKSAEVVNVRFSNGHEVKCTLDHPFYVTGKGMIPLRNIKVNDILLSIWNIKEKQVNKVLLWNLQNTKELSLNDTQILKTKTEIIFTNPQAIEKKEYKNFIKKFGKTTMEQYRKVVLFITRMKTLLTIQLKTWCVSLKQNIILFTLQRDGKIKNIGKKEQMGLENGTKQKRGRSISSFYITKVESHKGLYVKTVLENIWHFIQELISFVQNNATKSLTVSESINEINLNIGKQDIVNGAKNHFKRCDIDFKSVALYPTQLVYIGKIKEKQTVYNLHIEDEHEYFANGILVSNCFATLYYRLAVASQGNGVFIPETSKLYQIISDDNKVGEWSKYFDKLKYEK